MTAADAERMVRAADDAGVHLMEAFMYRHHPSWVAAVELVRAGRIGTLRGGPELVLVLQRRPEPTSATSWRPAAGPCTTSAATTSACRGSCSTPSRRGPGERSPATPATGTDVLTSAILRFEDRRRHVHLLDSGRDRPARPHLRTTTAGSASTSRSTSRRPLPTRIHLTHGGEPPVAPATETFTFEPADPYGAEVEAFSSAVLDGRPTPVPASDAVANLRVIERIFAAGDGSLTDPWPSTTPIRAQPRPRDPAAGPSWPR